MIDLVFLHIGPTAPGLGLRIDGGNQTNTYYQYILNFSLAAYNNCNLQFLNRLENLINLIIIVLNPLDVNLFPR